MSEQPSTTIDVKKLFTLYYRTGRHPHPLSTNFEMPTDDLKKAINEGLRHCQAMNYKFVQVDPFVTDFKKKEETFNA